LAYKNKFNLKAAYGNVYARRAQTMVETLEGIANVKRSSGRRGGKRLLGKINVT